MVATLPEAYFCPSPASAVARLLSPRSGLLLDAQSDACLRDMWVEAVVLGRSRIVWETRCAKMSKLLVPLSASVVTRLRRRLRMFVGKESSDGTESYTVVARRLLQEAGMIE
ncbi:hypothetical protein HK405_004360 [Cladochytrium tenue]|nr:hypothetical protein HK405_004360 [Cladochytrium tenue]